MADQSLHGIAPSTFYDSAPPSEATPPFDNGSADTILCSSDNVHFHVHSALLREASPFLYGMLRHQDNSDDDVTRTHSTARNGSARPLMTSLMETSHILDALLRFCYPIADPILDNLTDISDVLQAAIKYEMEQVVVLTKRLLLSFVDDDPLRVWTIACRSRLEAEARIAAMKVQDTYPDSGPPPEMHEISAGAFHRLLRYKRVNGEVDDEFKFCCPSQATATATQGADLVSRDPYPSGFFAHPFADIVCRSSDGVEHSVHRIVLSMASPVLRDMLTELTHGKDATCGDLQSGRSILELPEHSCTLCMLLRLCYLTEDTDITIDYSLITPVIQAATKYQMDRVLDLVQRILKRMSSSDTLRTFLAISQSSIDSLIVRSLDTARPDIAEEYVPELETTSADPYYRMLKWRERSSDAYAKVSKETGLNAYWDKSSKDDNPIVDFDSRCGCGREPTVQTTLKVCLRDARKRINYHARVELEERAKAPEADLPHQYKSTLVSSVQKGRLCGECEQIVTRYLELDDYVQNWYSDAATGIDY